MRSSLRVLIDTNVFLSYLVGAPQQGGRIERLVTAALSQEFPLLIPEELLIEVAATLSTKPYFSRRISHDETTSFIAALRRNGEPLAPLPDALPSIVRDPRDDYLIAAAVLGYADYLVTGDRDLLALGDSLAPLSIIRPADFVGSVLTPADP